MTGVIRINSISGVSISTIRPSAIAIGQERHRQARLEAYHRRHGGERVTPNCVPVAYLNPGDDGISASHPAPMARCPWQSPQQCIVALESENRQLRLVIQDLRDQLRDAFAHIRVTREERSQIIQESRAIVQKIKNHQLENLACATISNVLIAAIGGPLTLGLSAISGIISTFLSAADTAKLVSRCDFLLDALDDIQ